jgi:hypothetical protein
LNSGSSSPCESRAGRRVLSSARCVVKLSRGRGYERGGDRSRICSQYRQHNVLDLPKLEQK